MTGSADRSEEKPTDVFTLLPTGTELPDMEQITSASIIPFTREGNILAAILSHRGLDIPGGHTEVEDTSLEQVVRRETHEEVCATLADDIKLVGVIHSTRLRNGKPTYMIIMTGTVDELLPLKFAPDEKSIGRREMPPADFVESCRTLSFMGQLVARACQIHHGNTCPPVRAALASAEIQPMLVV